jgi:hypothetical protein
MAEKVALSDQITAASRYSSLEQDRNPYLVRARSCAALTIPFVCPPQGFSATSQLPTPYQSLGARGSAILASKLFLTLFPNFPFFNYKIDDLSLEQLGAKKGETEMALAKRERAVVAEIDTAVFRPEASVSLLHLVITGNILLYIPPDPEHRARAFRLDQYVVRRDGAGNLLEFVIQEKIDFTALPPEVQAEVAKLEQFKTREPNSLQPAPLELYTHGYWDETAQNFVVYQEAGGVRIPGSEGTFKKGELPYLALRFSYQPGESYGRSYVEQYLGDLDSLEALSETLVEGSAASARIVFFVDPAGTTSLKVVKDARTGDVRSGRATDVTVLQVQKQQDLAVARAQAEAIEARLSYAFLLHSSIQRNGERVTAEEIRFMASELDDGLGGVYTLLAAEFQLPCVRLFEKRMEKRLKAPPLPTNIVKPIIVAGLEAIGRGHDQRNLQLFVKEVIGTLGSEFAFRYLKPLEFINRSAAAYGLDPTNLIASEAEVEQAEQQAQMQAMIQHLGPQAVQQMGGMAQTAMKAPAAPPQ